LLIWNWKHGPATGSSSDFAIYITGANYALCMYDGSGLVARADMPVDGTCGPAAASCWQATSKGLKYADRDATPNGVTKALLKSGKSGKTSVKVLGRGANLGLPSLPIASVPIRVQLITEERGICFDSTFSAAGVKANSVLGFKAKSD